MLFHNRSRRLNGQRRGFTLIELAIVLAVASLLFAGLWRLMASGNTQLRDQSAADQHKQLITAVKGFLQTTQGQAVLTAMSPNLAGATQLPLPTAANPCTLNTMVLGLPVSDFCNFLPAGFYADTKNAYGQTYLIELLKDNTAAGTAPRSYSFMIRTLDGDVIPDTSGGRIASMIGNDGGFIYTADVCGSGEYACGAFGSWTVDTASYSLNRNQKGRIASRTYSGDNVAIGDLWLARKDTTGLSTATVSIAGGTAPDLNTIQTNTYFGTNGSLIGGTGTSYGGTISRVREVTLGRSTATGNAALSAVESACTPTGPDDASCSDIAYFKGRVTVSGLLSADNLFAIKFIYNTGSDRALKKDIALIQNPLERMSKINGYSFVMKDSGEKKYGVIAQEVEKVFPEVVVPLGGGDYKGVDYMGLVGPLVASVNELKAENDKLKESLLNLQRKVETLEARKGRRK